MRFAHLSDTHLGKRLSGLYEYENDFYELFEKTVDKIIELDVDFVIHSGDLFNENNPSTNSLMVFQDQLVKLNEANIPVYAISGNHDLVFRSKIMPSLVLFKRFGLNLIDGKQDSFYEGDILICGVQHVKKSKKAVLMDKIEELSNLAKNQKSILILHQGIDDFLFEGAGEFELGELLDNFTYYAMGHLHEYIKVEKGNGFLVYPGSMGLFKAYKDLDEIDKGFCVVDMSGEKPIIERIKIDIPRKWIEKTIRYENLSEELNNLHDELIQFDNKPLLELRVKGNDFKSSDIRELIYDSLNEHVSNLRISYISFSSSIDEEVDPAETLNPKAYLIKKIDEIYDDKDFTGLSVDLFESLSKNKLDVAKELCEDYFNQHFMESEEISQETSECLEDHI